MATPTYIPIATVTLATVASGVYFDGISQDYSDLILAMSFSGGYGNGTARISLNADTGRNYPYQRMVGDGSSASGFQGTLDYMGPVYLYAPTGEPMSVELQLFDYTATDKQKTGIIRNGTASVGVVASAHRWASTSAVTGLSINAGNANNFAAGSKFTLLGIHGEVV